MKDRIIPAGQHGYRGLREIRRGGRVFQINDASEEGGVLLEAHAARLLGEKNDGE